MYRRLREPLRTPGQLPLDCWQRRRPFARCHFVNFLVVRLANEEQRPRFRVRLPACPRAAHIAEPLLNPEHRHQCSVERKCAIEALDADKDVGEHGDSAPMPDAMVRRVFSHVARSNLLAYLHRGDHLRYMSVVAELLSAVADRYKQLVADVRAFAAALNENSGGAHFRPTAQMDTF